MYARAGRFEIRVTKMSGLMHTERSPPGIF